jgi:hypothetical protein
MNFWIRILLRLFLSRIELHLDFPFGDFGKFISKEKDFLGVVKGENKNAI